MKQRQRRLARRRLARYRGTCRLGSEINPGPWNALLVGDVHQPLSIGRPMRAMIVAGVTVKCRIAAIRRNDGNPAVALDLSIGSRLKTQQGKGDLRTIGRP